MNTNKAITPRVHDRRVGMGMRSLPQREDRPFVASAAIATSGFGGDGPWGGGALPAVNGAGNSGLSYGGGGSGACTISGGSARAGGAGGNGVLIIWEFA